MTALRDELQISLEGGYVIEEELAGGGMSRVFVAEDVALCRKVVVKMLPPELAADVSVDRFKHEIQFAARLQHPHIVPVLAAGEAGGIPYYVMPLVHGESLRAHLSRLGECTVSETVRILRDVAAALAHAHANGIVHRDVKPENIMLSGDVAVVSDFGIAKAITAAAIAASGESITGRGVALGTPAYMSPEQASADPNVDHRADIYALGCVGYELLTGCTPFAGRAPQQMLAAHVTDAPELVAQRRPSVPPALAGLVMRCLAKHPADRPQTAQDVVDALDAISTPDGGSPPIDARVRRIRRYGVRWWWVIGGGLVTAGVIATAVWLRPPGTYVVGASQVLLSSPDVELDGSISPDGKWVAYAAGPIERMRIFVRAVSGGRTLALGDDVPGSHRWPRWSPDGTQIAFATRDAVYIIPAPQGGFPQRVFDATPIQAGINTGTVAWSPDGKTLAVADLRGLWLKAIDGGRPRKLVEAEQANSPAWSPDGKTLAFVSGNNTFIFGNNAPSSIWIVSASGGQPRSVTDQSHLNTSPVWTPDGRSLLYVSNRDGPRDVYEQSFRRGWRPAGQPARLSTGLNPSAITLSADGTRLAFAQFVVRASVWSAPVSPDHPTRPSEARLITDENDAIESVAISHDGKWLLYDANRNGNQDIFKLALVDSATSREPVQLTHDPGDDFGGRWSPDDREVAFYSTRFGTRDIFVMGSDGRDVQRVTSSRWEEMGPDWSPDGKQLAFGAFNGDSSNVQLTQRDEHGTWLQARVLAQSRTGFDVGSPRWSPDGRWISFTGGNLYVVEPATGRVRQLLDRATFGRIVTFAADWGRDPSIVFIHAVGADGHSFWAVPVNGGRPRLLLNLGQLSPRVQPYFATDGHRIFFTRASTEADIWLMTLKR